jgi:sec-independent protein translocase protein TatA
VTTQSNEAIRGLLPSRSGSGQEILTKATHVSRHGLVESENSMGFHWTELLLITLVALLVFGPKRLPEVGSAIGKTVKEFKKSVHELSDTTNTDA